MKLAQLEHGQIQIVRLRSSGGDQLPAGLQQGREVTLLRPDGIEDVLLRVGGDALIVEGATRKDAQELEALFTTALPRIVWVLQVTATEVLVQVHTFAGRLQGTLELALDDKAIDDAKRANPRLRSASDVIGWLSDQCLLPVDDGGAGGGPAQRAFLAAGTGRDLEGAFAVHGRALLAFVRREPRPDGTARFMVQRIARGRGRGDGDEGLFLAEGPILFVDRTTAGEMRMDIQAQLAQLGAEEGGFINLWTKWRSTEANAILHRARVFGALAYERLEELAGDLIRFDLVESARTRLDPAITGDELEAATEPPLILTTPDVSWDDYEEADRRASRGPSRAKPFVGTVKQVLLRENSLILDRARVGNDRPPPRGILFLSVLGDRARLRRQREATEAIRAGTNPMCQLGMLLEDRPVPPSRAGSLPALSSAVRRKVFGKHGPTRKQELALRVALNTPDIALIQGPPGTGKTTVVTALVERLNEELEGGEGNAGHVLLSGFQHDAVENAIARMSVNGLPTVKFGSRRGAEEDVDATDDAIDRWSRERAAALGKRVIPQTPTAIETEISLMMDGWLLAPAPRDQTATLLGRIATFVAGHVPSPLVEELRAAQRRLTARDGGGGADAELVRRVRAIRTTATAFSDDGAITAFRALRVLTEAGAAGAVRFEADECALLEQAAACQESDAPPLDALRGLRRKLLLRLAPSAFSDAQPRLRMDVAELFAQVRDALASRAAGSRDAIEEAAADLLAAYEGDPEYVKRSILGYMAVYAATCQQSARLWSERKRGEDPYRTVVVDEAARANPLDLFIPISQAARRIVLVGDHRQLPHVLDRQLQFELEQSLNRSAPNAAMRMNEMLNQSLFQRLFESLKRRHEAGEACRTVTLDEQFRMHPRLGRFVSDEFYKGDEAFESPLDESHFVHALPGYSGPAAWIDVPRARGFEKRGQSKSRPLEANAIVQELRRLIDSEAARTLNFGIITFYAAQVDAIKEALRQAGFVDEEGQIVETYRDLVREGDKRVERLRYGTVDAFQGMEFDVVFLSMVRCNDLADGDEAERRKKYGHLMSPNRLCVSMSRQMRLLIVAGDTAMLREPGAEAAIGPLVRFERLCNELGGRHV